jgi:putative membrane protein
MRMSCALTLLCAVLGCTSQGSEAAERQRDTAGRRDSIAAVAAASMNEAQVIGLLHFVHAADSALGMLGAVNGSTRDIKDFGQMIVREHRALSRDAMQLGANLHLVPTEPSVAPDAPPDDMRGQLRRPAGAIWDQLYLDYAIAMHQSSMENSARALAATRSPATREFITKSVPILQKHLDKATSLRRARDTASNGASPTNP